MAFTIRTLIYVTIKPLPHEEESTIIKYCYVYLLHSKDESLNLIEEENTSLKTLQNFVHTIEKSNITSGAPHSLWGEACLTANMVINRIPHEKSDKPPYELWKGKLPSYKMMKAWVALRSAFTQKDKIGPKTVDCVYLCPARNNVAYRFLVYKSNVKDIHNNTILESIEAEFFKSIFPYKDKEKEISNSRKKVCEDVTTFNTKKHVEEGTLKAQEEVIEPRRSKRGKIAKDFGPDFMTFIVNEEPQSYRDAMDSSEALSWKEAIQSEIDSIVQNNTWRLVDLLPGHKRKQTTNGTIEKYKARLVAKGYHQKEGQDFFDTYSPVTRITSIRTLMAIAAIHNLQVDQMDVETAFLNGELDEKSTCNNQKSLYGLKQSPKQWHEKFDNTLLSNGFQIKECDKCVYNTYVIICLHVDDMLIMGTNLDIINQTKKMLNSSFDMKDLGVADVILGIKIQKDPNGYTLTQFHNVEKVLRKFGYYDDRPVVTPFDPSSQVKKNQGDSVSQLEYTQLLGSLMYIMNCTRSDLAFPLVVTLHQVSSPVLEGYCDANSISIHSESKSTSGYVFTLGGASISWKSSKQIVNTWSTMEVEFVALDKAAEEAECLKSFLEGIPLWPKPITTVSIHCDSMAALTRAKNQIYNDKSRHIRRRHKTIRDLLKNGIISINYVKSKENMVDPLTKGLNEKQVSYTSRGMGLKPIQ
ncbi:LOW QUALITY PROTEIN: hypothetical protein OSB04_016595 [Centaurea solstitialis]|uniref:Reverse transcriptase Ty1/copia-type domain-containing protein n=1 Tax=Centaurea solstitialis TaxID=347529 RepID=A0AA38TD48_9ASTR|nr:LOW QUALITY PROTEIN: hypothetical protein OSB04_016595 [Centaurea solstitialis]